jgi:hypothetical protein
MTSIIRLIDSLGVVREQEIMNPATNNYVFNAVDIMYRLLKYFYYLVPPTCKTTIPPPPPIPETTVPTTVPETTTVPPTTIPEVTTNSSRSNDYCS